VTTIYILFAVAGVLWLFSMGCGAVALFSCCFPGRLRFWLTIVLSGLAILIGFLGMTRFQVTYSRTVNGSGWSINSKWFFIAPLVLGIFALVLAIWRRSRSSRASRGS
jgi:hypothetical protein